MQQRLVFVLSVLAGALLAALVFLTNLARLGGAIAAEIRHAQISYMDFAQSSPLREANALQLGQCLRRAMLKTALTEFAQGEAWVMRARAQALPACQRNLPPLVTLAAATTGLPSVHAGVAGPISSGRGAAPAKRLSRLPLPSR